jgi:hypothetical protein
MNDPLEHGNYKVVFPSIARALRGLAFYFHFSCTFVTKLSACLIVELSVDAASCMYWTRTGDLNLSVMVLPDYSRLYLIAANLIWSL